jgi:hypothetical protein
MLTLNLQTLKALREQQNYFDTGQVTASVFAVDVFNQLFYKGHDAAKIIFDSRFIPSSYWSNPTAWRDNHQNKIKFPYVDVKCKGKTVELTVSKFKIISNFTKRLAFELEQYQEAKIQKSEIPGSYQINPWQIIRRLKLRAKVSHITKTHITWKLRK